MPDGSNEIGHETLSFENEKGSSRSKWVAGGLAVSLIGWMGSGVFLPSDQGAKIEKPKEAAPVAVMVQHSTARKVTKTFSAEGQAQPNRRATLRPKASGEVVEILAAKGTLLNAGDDIARLSTRELRANLVEAQQELSRAREAFESEQALFERNITTASNLRNARASLASAEAQLTQEEEALEAAVLRAPFSGRLDSLDLEIGSFVSSGSSVGVMLDTEPLRIVIQVPQQSLGQITEGLTATVSFITGEERSGTIEYISRDAQSETRTFRAEIVVPNPDRTIASGLSVRVRIPTEDVLAHFVSPAILSLSEDGLLGLKTIDSDNRVRFHEVVVERAQRDGVWVSGLPSDARIITIGQGFVSAGEIVAPTLEDTPPTNDPEGSASAGVWE